MVRSSACRLIITAVFAVVVTACGTGGSSVRSANRATTVAPPTSVAAAAAPDTTASVAPESTSPATRAGGDESAPEATDEAPAPTSARLIDRIDTGGASKVITVMSESWSSPSADLVLWERRADDGWDQVGGPWTADVGRAGWAYEPGEATLRSPIGSFGFGTGFGLRPDPGYAGGWFDITDTDYWVEDPASPDYNTRQQGPADPSLAPWGRFEHLADYSVAYRYAALINFNVPARGPIGSGIFLHQATGSGSTAGCVALPEDELLTTLRWIEPASTLIVMGPASEF